VRCGLTTHFLVSEKGASSLASGADEPLGLALLDMTSEHDGLAEWLTCCLRCLNVNRWSVIMVRLDSSSEPMPGSMFSLQHL